MITTITPPDMNDSFSRVVLSGKEYQIRFTYNDRFDFWTFGIYDMERHPLTTGIKIVPNFPLNFFCRNKKLPAGEFGAISGKNHIGRHDFRDGNAKFNYIPESDIEGGLR